MRHIPPWAADLALLAVTAIWGSTFVIVKDAIARVPPFTFLAVRFGLAFVLLAALYPRRLARLRRPPLRAGAIMGLALAAGYGFQTLGLQFTTAAKAGFITGLSVVMVPVFSIVLLQRRPPRAAWLGVVFATAGLGLLTLGPDLAVNLGDVLVFFCAIGFALQIIATGRHAPDHDPVQLTLVQVGLSAVLYAVAAAAWEPAVDMRALTGIWPALLITAALATALAFVVQTLAQQFTSPTHTALIFSAEPVWSALFAYWLAGEGLTTRGLAGAALILLGMVLAEWPAPAAGLDPLPGERSGNWSSTRD